MNLSASEKATLNFYQWECLGRGYYLFDQPIHIEPPYIPFSHQLTKTSEVVDDGRVPSLFELGKRLLLRSSTQDDFMEDSLEIEPLPFSKATSLMGFSVYFPKSTEITSIVNEEFLNTLSFVPNPLTFELVASFESLEVQIICDKRDYDQIQSYWKAFFPEVIIRTLEDLSLPFNTDSFVAIADFGLNSEFMCPIATNRYMPIDPLTSIIAVMDNLNEDEVALFQAIFKGVTAPWARDIQISVSDGVGGSFFKNSPEMLHLASDKVASPLFSVVMRIAAQAHDQFRSRDLSMHMINGIMAGSLSESNKLIPLSNEGYDYQRHLQNVLDRQSNRFGMILNAQELSNFVHYPNKNVVSSKLSVGCAKTKKLPTDHLKQKYSLGSNIHLNDEYEVTISDEHRLRHTHIIGATGVGKSTFITNMVLQDIVAGNGVAVFDPHGDLCERIAERIPEERLEDVVLVDPYDLDYPIGFNLFTATTEAEAIVLGSDLVASFKRQSTSWGDNINAVLSNAINTFLVSGTPGTLLELKRFLVEKRYRDQYLETVDDPALLYYWKNEYPMLRKGISPLLTRIDAFLRPRVIRNMLAQKSGVDFKKCIDQKKIVLIKLAQGLIGEENSYLLGSIFLAKLNQVALGRQSIPRQYRHPFYIYLDEFQNFITPSIVKVLSGARKYGIGITLAHQDLGQIVDQRTLNSVLSNPFLRVCFRLGDIDANKLEAGFSYFDSTDLQDLGIGQTIVRAGAKSKDFNMSTQDIAVVSETVAYSNLKRIIANTRKKYSIPKLEVDAIINSLYSGPEVQNNNDIETLHNNPDSVAHTNEEELVETIPVKVKEHHRKRTEASQNLREHAYLQSLVKKLGQDRGFNAIIEKEVKDGRVDVSLERKDLKLAIEVAVHNTAEYELKNIVKCFNAEYDLVVSLSNNKDHLLKINKLVNQHLPNIDIDRIYFISQDELTAFLDELMVIDKKSETTEIVKGFRVTTEFETSESHVGKKIKENLTRLFFNKSK